MPRKAPLIFIALLALGLVTIWIFKQPSSTPEAEKITLPKPPPPTPEAMQTPPGDLIGEKLLHAYASEQTTIHDDLQAISRVSLSYITLVKNHANQPIGCNADLADALRGKNPHKQRFIPDNHPVFNNDGEMIDRWKTPLFIHPVSAGQWEIRSAGPDKTLWTNDDLELKTDGTFKEGLAE